MNGVAGSSYPLPIVHLSSLNFQLPIITIISPASEFPVSFDLGGKLPWGVFIF